MAIDPNILLRGIIPEPGVALLRGVQAGQAIRNPQGNRGGLASAKTVTYNNGTVLQALPNGETQVRGPNGAIVEGTERSKVLQDAQQSGITAAGQKAFAVGEQGQIGRTSGQQQTLSTQAQINEQLAAAEAKGRADAIEEARAAAAPQKSADEAAAAGAKVGAEAVAAEEAEAGAAPAKAGRVAESARQTAQAKAQQVSSEKAFARVESFEGQIRKLDKAIGALQKGAQSGIVRKNLPAFTQATTQLREAAKELGIEVINSATFGALSAPELELALTTAVDQNLDEDDLLQFLQDKQAAMKKVRDGFQEMAIFLSKPGNTKAKWFELQEEIRSAREGGGESQGGQTFTSQSGIEFTVE